MYTDKVVKFFGSKTAVAKALGITQVAVTHWGLLVPEGRAARLERITDGALIYEPQLYDDHSKKRKEDLIHENQQGSDSTENHSRN
ncbi:Cro/CI family transcriptional regulator [Pantoea coffeiphila]|uniref:Transcriptional regulator n=1 Tax=Pantoea coffeiphila TaxID=1465635 RepID=A0A2S9I889_9GAMM|nr:Cro/CI family transcriptional regulator [Pantoea coffeiphila]PRD14010.1 transcriptional regulator [Pantoea coffeiphila]